MIIGLLLIIQIECVVIILRCTVCKIYLPHSNLPLLLLLLLVHLFSGLLESEPHEFGCLLRRVAHLLLLLLLTVLGEYVLLRESHALHLHLLVLL